MIIHPQAMEINDSDDKHTIMAKRYYASLWQIQNQWKAEKELERQRSFDKKYNEIKKMKQSMRTNAEKLTVMTAIDEVLNDFK